MGRTVTLAQMRAKVIARYDLQTPTGTSYVNSTVLPEFINGSIAAYVGLLQECELEEYYTYEDTIATIPGQAWVDTGLLSSAQFQGLRAVHWVRGTDDVIELKRAQRGEWYSRSWAAQAWDGYRPSYVLIRDQIYFMPPPSGAQTMRVFYTGIPNDLNADGDYFYAGPGWEEWIVADVCWKIAEREDQDPTRFITRRNTAEKAIRDQLPREAANPPMVQRQMFRDADPDSDDYGRWR